jgi:predicted ATPase
MENFVSWYRYLSQDQGLAFQLTSELKEIMPGFDSFKFGQVGKEHRLLQVCFETDAKALTSYDFDELSDGQRMLIALYTLLHVAHVDQGLTLCLDEPGNFVALPEIQPWLIKLYDRCMAGQMQALLISHHPEPIDYLLASPVGYWFERQDNNRPTRIKPITADGQGGLPISEIVARGWLHE